MASDPSYPNRLPAPSPCKSCLVSKAGWITALVATLLAAFFFFQSLTHQTEAKLQRNNAELSRIETQSLKQQLFAERILAERQITDLTNNAKSDQFVFVHLSASAANTASPTGIIAWQPSRQSGVFFADQLPIPAAEEELRLWIEDGNGSGVINAGVVSVDSARTTKVEFKGEKAMGSASRFTVTRERKGSTTAPAGPIVLSGTP